MYFLPEPNSVHFFRLVAPLGGSRRIAREVLRQQKQRFYETDRWWSTKAFDIGEPALQGSESFHLIRLTRMTSQDLSCTSRMPSAGS